MDLDQDKMDLDQDKMDLDQDKMDLDQDKMDLDQDKIDLDQDKMDLDQDHDYDHLFKILLVGNSCVGKSNTILRFSDDLFHESFLPTIGFDFKIKNIDVNNQNINLHIWDTAGQER